MREATGPTIELLPVTAHLLQPVIERAVSDPGRAIATRREPVGDSGRVDPRVRAAARRPQPMPVPITPRFAQPE
jgi:hypothetical protein